jgi:hypothetical protein
MDQGNLLDILRRASTVYSSILRNHFKVIYFVLVQNQITTISTEKRICGFVSSK